MLALSAYCDRHDIGYVVGPGAVVFDKNELQPDVEVIPGHHDPMANTKWEHLPFPLLVVEVLSDSTRQRDFGKKKAAYERVQINTYWIVDPDNRRVIAYSVRSAEPDKVTDVLRWQPRSDLSALEIPLETIFGKAPEPS